MNSGACNGDILHYSGRIGPVQSIEPGPTQQNKKNIFFNCVLFEKLVLNIIQ
jgi:hypothetical protein